MLSVTIKEGKEKMESGTFQKCTSEDVERTDTDRNVRNSDLIKGSKFSL